MPASSRLRTVDPQQLPLPLLPPAINSPAVSAPSTLVPTTFSLPARWIWCTLTTGQREEVYRAALRAATALLREGDRHDEP